MGKFVKKVLSSFIFFALLFNWILPVRALELVISENGSGSNSEVNVQQTTQTEVKQSNAADVGNRVETNTVTGQNSASGNTGGDESISTGDVKTQAAVSTSVNYSTAEVGCCPSGMSATISGNGAGSENKINLNQQATTQVLLNQIAAINNNITANANTGGNVANNNTGGNVSIQTGSIKVIGQIDNIANIASVKITSGITGAIVSISGNGFDSKNEINALFISGNEAYLYSSADVENYVVWSANTGENKASRNTGGNVNIKTGDVDLNLFIKNLANLGGVKIDCCPIPFDPGKKDTKPDEPAGGPPLQETPSGDKGKEESKPSGVLLPSAAATEAGGPGIIGLSDTSSESAQALFFWIALAMIAFGGRIVVNEAFPKLSGKRK